MTTPALKIREKIDNLKSDYSDITAWYPVKKLRDMIQLQKRNPYTFETNSDYNVAGILERIKIRMQNESGLLLQYEADFLNDLNRFIQSYKKT